MQERFDEGGGIDARWRYPSKSCPVPVSLPETKRTDESCLIDSVTDRGEPLHRVRCFDWLERTFAIRSCAGDWLGGVLACSTWQDAGRRTRRPRLGNAKLTRRLRVGEKDVTPGPQSRPELPNVDGGSTSRPASAVGGSFWASMLGLARSRLVLRVLSFRFFGLWTALSRGEGWRVTR